MNLGGAHLVSKKEICNEFGQLLRRRRSEADLSQGEFAKALGLSRTSITNIERGRQPVSLPMLYAMADILQREVADLLPPIKPLLRSRKKFVGTASERDPLSRISSKEADWLGKISTPRNLG